MPDQAFPPVGRLGLTSPRSPVLCLATTATCPSRCPVLPLVHRYLACSFCSCPRLRASSSGFWSFTLMPGLLGLPVRLFRFVYQESFGSPKFPGYPLELMPCSLTPVVSSALALARSGLLPSATMNTSAFPLFLLTVIYCPRLYKFRGSITRPVFLLPSASDFRYRTYLRGSLLPCWLGFRQVELSPTG